jgi:sporulation protein YlmC with PRC-barrel domain
MRWTIFATTAAAAFLFGPAVAQQQPAPPAAPTSAAGPQQPAPAPVPGTQAAEKCLGDLTALGEQMDREGYWLAGYRGGAGSYGVTAPPGTTAAPGAATTTGTAAPTAGAAATATGGGALVAPGVGPWGDVGWATTPSDEIGTLYAAAEILARRGDEQACQTVLGEAREAYGQYVAQLRQAGVEPGGVAGWRQEQILAARPLTELQQRGFRIDDVLGTGVRNPRDEYLGEVEDVLLDPETGKLAYAIVARGGFLGAGEEEVAVPWDRLKATPGMNTLVLDIAEEALEGAPEVDPDALADDPNAFRQWRQEIDRFWQQHAAR